MVEQPKDGWQGDASAFDGRVEPIERGAVVVRNDLRQIEVAREMLISEVTGLRVGVGVRIRAAAERQARHVRLNVPTELPGVLHAPCRADAAIAAENHQRPESLVPGPLRVAEA